jgi:hypothetical protein
MAARIYCPARTATQSGFAKSHDWVLDFEPGEPRHIDPLMGWTGSGDMLAQIRLRFATKEEAIAYAHKAGLSYRVEDPKAMTRKVIAYSDNFKPGRIDLWTH